MIKIIIKVWLLFFISNYVIAIDKFEFTSPEQSKRFDYLIQNTKCVTCPNQNLAGSNAPVALAMQQEIYEQIKHNKDINEIEEYLVTRYGQQVLFKPKFNINTVTLWLMPIFIIFIFGFVFYWVVKKISLNK